MRITIGLGLLGTGTRCVLPGISEGLLPSRARSPSHCGAALQRPGLRRPARVTSDASGIRVEVLGAWNSVTSGTFTSTAAQDVTMSGFVHSDDRVVVQGASATFEAARTTG